MTFNFAVHNREELLAELAENRTGHGHQFSVGAHHLTRDSGGKSRGAQRTRFSVDVELVRRAW